MKHVLLDIPSAAQQAGVTTKAIYAAIARQSLPRRYLRGNLVVREADLLEWHSSKSRGGRPKGQKMSPEAKRKISEANKKRWAERRDKSTQNKTAS